VLGLQRVRGMVMHSGKGREPLPGQLELFPKSDNTGSHD
jgi:hypothetical protein